MFAVIFEVNPKPEQWEAYLGYAKICCGPSWSRSTGFIDNERFSSLRRQGWLLSLSIWRDEKAVIRWRTPARHHEIQQKGRTEVFRRLSSAGRRDHRRQPIARRPGLARAAL